MDAFEQDAPATAAALRRAADVLGAATMPAERAPVLPALVGLLRCVLGVVRFALVLLRETGAPDPIHERPRILQQR